MAEVDLTESNGGALVVTAITFLVLSWLSVILRAYVRAILTKSFQADDWLMLVAQVRVTIVLTDSIKPSDLKDRPSSLSLVLLFSLAFTLVLACTTRRSRRIARSRL